MSIVPFLLLLAAPLLEIGLLVKVGQTIGLWWTMALIVGTGLLGVAVLMDNGLLAARRVQEAMQRGEAPLAPLIESALVVLAGVLLITPGLICDAVGLLLLVSPPRRLCARVAARRMFGIQSEGRAPRSAEGRTSPGTPGEGRTFETREREQRRDPRDGPVIEGEFERLDERTMDPKRRRPNGADHP